MKERVRCEKMARRRRLLPNMITVHNKPNCRGITFNLDISDFLKRCNLNYVEFRYSGDFPSLVFYKEMKSGCVKLLPLKNNGKNVSFIVSNHKIVHDICNVFKLEEGDYHFSFINTLHQAIDIRDISLFTIILDKVLDKQPISIMQEGQENDIISVQIEFALSKCTDRQLWDELKRRGYEGKLYRHNILK